MILGLRLNQNNIFLQDISLEYCLLLIILHVKQYNEHGSVKILQRCEAPSTKADHEQIASIYIDK